MSEETGEWLECVCDKDYEIFSEYPYPIKRKGSDRIISEWIRKGDGYVECQLNTIHYLKHRIIAQQFIPNPNNLPFIDHVDNNRANNRIENLRWVNRSENNKNRAGYRYQYVFLDELPETAESLDAYNGHEFDGLFVDYENEKLYLFNGVRYREVIGTRTHGNIYYQVYDIEDKRRRLAHKVLFS